MGCAKTIEEMLEIKVIEVGGNEEVFSSEAWRRAFDINEPIYMELCHEFFSTFESNEEFSRHLGLYKREEILEEGFEVYFQGGLRDDNYFDANEYWTKISTEDQLRLTIGYDKIQRNEPWLLSMFEDRNRERYANVAWVIARSLDATNLRELIGPVGKLIAEDPTPEILMFSIPRPPRPSLQYLTDRMGHMEHMDGHYEVQLDGDYAPPSYDEQQQ
ncbi:hypothetical protein Tco_0071522 [Tanacetum coccineum]